MLLTRDQLVEFIEQHAAAVCGIPSNAVDEGQYEFLGGFSKIPASNYPGFILRITYLKKTWLVALIAGESRILLRLIQEIPWRLWQGNDSRNPLYWGDRPEIYQRIKNATTQMVNGAGSSRPDIQKNPTAI